MKWEKSQSKLHKIKLDSIHPALCWCPSGLQRLNSIRYLYKCSQWALIISHESGICMILNLKQLFLNYFTTYFLMLMKAEQWEVSAKYLLPGSQFTCRIFSAYLISFVYQRFCATHLGYRQKSNHSPPERLSREKVRDSAKISIKPCVHKVLWEVLLHRHRLATNIT